MFFSQFIAVVVLQFNLQLHSNLSLPTKFNTKMITGKGRMFYDLIFQIGTGVVLRQGFPLFKEKKKILIWFILLQCLLTI